MSTPIIIYKLHIQTVPTMKYKILISAQFQLKTVRIIKILLCSKNYGPSSTSVKKLKDINIPSSVQNQNRKAKSQNPGP
jgi:hypothetical protein